MINNSIDDKSLNRSLWILKNIRKIRVSIKLFFVFIILFEIYIFTVNFIDVYASGDQFAVLYDQSLNNKNFITFDKYLKSIAPQSLSIKESGIVNGYGDKYYDIYAYVENSSESYKLDSFDYYFEYNGGLKTEHQKSKINLKESKYVFSRGIISDVEFKDQKLIITDYLFKLVDKTKKIVNRYSDSKVPPNCESKVNNIITSDIKIITNKSAKTNVVVTTIDFVVSNDSLYDYNSINNKILFLDDADKIVGIEEKEVYQLKSKEKKNVNFNLSPNLTPFKNILIIPEVDLCDEASFIDKPVESKGI